MRRRRPRSTADAASGGHSAPGSRPSSVQGARSTAVRTCLRSVSTMQLPTRCTRSGAMPSASEVRVRALLGREEVGREVVGDDAIDLLGHRAVEGAQSRFDVAEGNPLFRGNERDRRRGVDVSSDEDDVGSVLPADLLERRHDPGGLAGVRVGADLEVDVGPRHAELIEEDAATCSRRSADRCARRGAGSLAGGSAPRRAPSS